MTRALAYWWLLLVIPAALVIGWGIGQLPTPERSLEPVAPRPDPPPATTAPTRTGATAVDGASHGGPAVDSPDAGAPPTEPPPPAEPPRPSEPARRSELSQWTTLENAIAESRRNGKPVMIDFNADWCPPCRRMKEEVFQDGAHASAVQTLVIPVSVVDRAREDGRNPPDIEELQRRYQVDAFPTLIVFSPANGRVVRTKGYGDAQGTVAWITEAARSVR